MAHERGRPGETGGCWSRLVARPGGPGCWQPPGCAPAWAGAARSCPAGRSCLQPSRTQPSAPLAHTHTHTHTDVRRHLEAVTTHLAVPLLPDSDRGPAAAPTVLPPLSAPKQAVLTFPAFPTLAAFQLHCLASAVHWPQQRPLHRLAGPLPAWTGRTSHAAFQMPGCTWLQLLCEACVQGCSLCYQPLTASCLCVLLGQQSAGWLGR